MKLFQCLCLLILPNYCFLLGTDGQLDPPSLRSLISQKDLNELPAERIIGGQEVSPHAYPFQVGLFINTVINSRYFCGGTLISREWVLTAARCLYINVSYILVYLGTHNVTAPNEETRTVLNSTEFFYHPDWNAASSQNDIGLVRLPRNVTLNDHISTVKFARGDDTYANRIGTMVGWGLTETTTSIAHILRTVNSTVITNQECNSGPHIGIIAPTHICVSGSGVVGTCNGDTGGPLLVDGIQVGVASFTTPNCTLGNPSVFTRISEFEDWIALYVRDSSESYNLYCSLVISVVVCLYQLFIVT